MIKSSNLVTPSSIQATNRQTLMKRNVMCAAAFALLSILSAQPGILNAQGTAFTYQGRVMDNGTAFNGTGLFKFALVTSTNISSQALATANMGNTAPNEYVSSFNLVSGGNGYASAPAVTITGGGGSGATATATVSGGVVTAINLISPGSGYSSTPTVSIAAAPADVLYTTYWSNDGTSSGGSQPTTNVTVAVTNGLFTLLLGGTSVPNMTAIPANLFAQQTALQLQIWFSDGINGFAMLSPLQNLTPVPYATFANTSSNLTGTLPVQQLNGTIPLGQLPAGVVTNTGTSVTLSGTFSGIGAGLTTLNANNLSSGTVPLARLPGTILSGVTWGVNGDNTGNFANGVMQIENENPTANSAPALRLFNSGTGSPYGALSVSVGSSTNGAIATFGNPGAFVADILADGSIFSNGSITNNGSISCGGLIYCNNSISCPGAINCGNLTSVGGTVNGNIAFGQTSGVEYIVNTNTAEPTVIGGITFPETGASPALRVVSSVAPWAALSVSVENMSDNIAVFGNSSTFTCTIANNGTITANGVVLTSDRNAKENFQSLDPQSVLAKVAAMPVTKWDYKSEGQAVQHIGPVAQDFYSAFGLDGKDDKHISVVDEGGVALAAIQGLNQKLEAKSQNQSAEIDALKQQNAALAQQMKDLESMVKQLSANK
jgi:Chaperone of endosialidase